MNVYTFCDFGPYYSAEINESGNYMYTPMTLYPIVVGINFGGLISNSANIKFNLADSTAGVLCTMS